MKVWVNNEFTGHYPVGTSACVVANNTTEAADMLNGELINMGLKGDATPEQFQRIYTNKPSVHILDDGSY